MKFDMRSLYDEDADELRIMFSDCYGILEDKVIKVINFENMDESRVELKYKVINKEGGPSTSKYTLFDNLVNLNLPSLGFIEGDRSAIFITRSHQKPSPSRYRKGLRPDTLVGLNLSSKEINDIVRQTGNSILKQEVCISVSGNPVVFDDYIFDHISYSVFFPNYKKWDEAISLITSLEKLSVPLSSMLAISLSRFSDKILIYHNLTPIGYWSEYKKKFIMKTELFNHELDKAEIPY